MRGVRSFIWDTTARWLRLWMRPFKKTCMRLRSRPIRVTHGVLWYLRQLLDEQGGEHIRIFGGGGGVIVPEAERFMRQALTASTIPGRPQNGVGGDDCGLVVSMRLQLVVSTHAGHPGNLGGYPKGGCKGHQLGQADVDSPGVLPDELREALHKSAQDFVPPLLGSQEPGVQGNRRSPMSWSCVLCRHSGSQAVC